MTSDHSPLETSRAALDLPPMVLPTHSLARYIRTRLDVTDGVLRWQVARTLVKIVPIGSRRIEIPLGDVDALRLLNPGNPIRVVAGLACLITPFFVLDWWAALPIAILLTWIVSIMLGPRLEVTTRSGTRHRANVCFSHQFDAELFIEAVGDLARQSTA